MNINYGANQNRWLSNFYRRDFIYEGFRYKSVEQAFQYVKYFSCDYSAENLSIARQILESTDPFAIKSLSKNYTNLNREVWDLVSSMFMKTFIKYSFIQNPLQMKRLLATGDVVFTHNTKAKPDKWVTEFPRILMEVREELKNFK